MLLDPHASSNNAKLALSLPRNHLQEDRERKREGERSERKREKEIGKHSSEPNQRKSDVEMGISSNEGI